MHEEHRANLRKYKKKKTEQKQKKKTKQQKNYKRERERELRKEGRESLVVSFHALDQSKRVPLKEASN